MREVDAGQTLEVDGLAVAAPLGMLVLDGFLVREMTTSYGVSADLLGPEDLVRAAELERPAAPLRFSVSWTAVTPLRLALLDHDFMRRGTRWPEIAGTLTERAARPGNRLVYGRAIATLPSVEMRLLASMWDWASHWGFVASSGMRLSLPLSQARIGRLIGARRPTVTAALGRLREQRLVEQLGAGEWLLLQPTGTRAEADPAELRIPMLEELPALLPARARRGAVASTAGVVEAAARVSPHPSGAYTTDKVVALKRRLAAQREALGIASARHEQMLARLQRESSQLRMNSTVLRLLSKRQLPDPPRAGAGGPSELPAAAEIRAKRSAKP